MIMPVGPDASIIGKERYTIVACKALLIILTSYYNTLYTVHALYMYVHVHVIMWAGSGL